MANQKIDNQLNLALDLKDTERSKTSDLDTGYNEETNTWELIVRYNGDLSSLEDDVVKIEALTNKYAILTVEEDKIDRISDYSQIEYIEKPNKVIFVLDRSKRAACIKDVQERYPELSGEGVLIGIIDSGIDYMHPGFINEDSTTKIAYLWDQTIEGNPPEGFQEGTEFTREDINIALSQETREEALKIVPSIDNIGHGTPVAGIAAGNGRGSDRDLVGVAPKSELIVVKLGTTGDESFSKTTEIMRAFSYVMKKAQEMNRPISINLSYGNNYGSHDGKSLFESYIDDMSNKWKNVISVGSGNEGIGSKHARVEINNTDIEQVEVGVSEFEDSLSIQLWKSYIDDIEIEIIAPNSESSGFIKPLLGTQQFVLGNTNVAIFFGEPSPYNNDQQIYIELIPTRKYIDDGIWKINIKGNNIVDGVIDLWLPVSKGLNINTKFLQPDPDISLTIPSTASKVITVGGYNQINDSIASFSGRGYTRGTNMVKPDIVAPAVDVLTTKSGGGYDAFTGTSFATPFVTGAAALLMEWGIVQGNDPFLYGEKVKSYLRKSARRTKSDVEYPDNYWGYGTLCLSNVFNNLVYKKIMTNNIYTIGEECNTAIISDDYLDLVLIYNDESDLAERTSRLRPECIQLIDDRFAILHKYIGDYNSCMDVIAEIPQAEDYTLPALVSPYGKSSLSASGILVFHDRPYLSLRGQGTIIGIVDSGIDYTHNVFRYEDNTSKILYIWDQTIEGIPPGNFAFGTEYNNDQINKALNSENPFDLVPSRDIEGHGTFLAGVAAGREDASADFVGAAPDAMIIAVKLKEAKACYKELYFVEDADIPVYQSNDLMVAVQYLVEKAREIGMPISIIIGLGSNYGGHDGTTITERYLANVAFGRGNVVSVAAGNEAVAEHHYKGIFSNNESEKDIEINVAKGESGFILYIWNQSPDKFSISITSPTGEYIGRIPSILTRTEAINLILEETVIYVEYELLEKRTGDQLTIIRMEKPTEGIWIITVYGDLVINGRIDAWLPRKGYIKPETRFMNPDPFTTITFPSTSISIMTVGAYNHQSDSIFIESGRGLTRDLELKPDFVAPGVNVIGPLPNNQFGVMTGTSVSTAIAGGAASLLLEWGIVLGNDTDMDTVKVINYFNKGARRKDGIDYPSKEWGYGALDLLGTFEALKGIKI
jgi:subtilisin family serine protease